MADTYQEFLDKRKRTAIAVFHRFRMEVARGLSHALFVEGFSDKLFYSHFLPCGNFNHSSVRITFGKKNMDRIVELFYSEGLDERCVASFIRDADFDEFLVNLPAGDCVKVLDRYSVENYVFTGESLRRLFLERFGLEEDEYNIDECVAQYEVGVQEIFNGLAPLIGAALAALQDGESIHLDGLDIRGIASEYFTSGVVRQLTDNDFSACKIDDCYRTDESTTLGNRFVQQDSLLWMRGHYLAHICSIHICSKVEEVREMRRQGLIQTINPSISGDFSPPALFERMAPLCSRPELMEQLTP